MLRYVLNKVIDLQVFAKMVCDQRLHVRQQYRRQPKGPCLRLRKHGHQGVNFINNLQVAFKRADPESAKKTDNLIEFFVLSGSACIKAAHRMLMKLTPGDQPQQSVLYGQSKWCQYPGILCQVLNLRDCPHRGEKLITESAQNILMKVFYPYH